MNGRGIAIAALAVTGLMLGGAACGSSAPSLNGFHNPATLAKSVKTAVNTTGLEGIGYGQGNPSNPSSEVAISVKCVLQHKPGLNLSPGETWYICNTTLLINGQPPVPLPGQSVK